MQGGLDLHINFWQWINDYTSTYGDVYKTDGGVYASFGMHGDIGTKFIFSDKLEVPLSFRTELIFAYGVLFQVGFMFGVNFK